MIKKQKNITNSRLSCHSTCNLPLSLQKVIVLDVDKCNTKLRKGMVPVRIYLKPDQLAEIIRLKIDLTSSLQDWFSDTTAVYQALLKGEEDDDTAELMELFNADEDNGDKLDGDAHK